MSYERYAFSAGQLATNPAIYPEEHYAGSDAESFYDPGQYNHLVYREFPRQPVRLHFTPTHEKSGSWEIDEIGRMYHVDHGHIREIDEEFTEDEELNGSYHDMLSVEDQDTFAHILTDPLPSQTTPPPTPIPQPEMMHYRRSIESQRFRPQISAGAPNEHVVSEDSGYMSGRSSLWAPSPVSQTPSRSIDPMVPNHSSTPSPLPSIPFYGSRQVTERSEGFSDAQGTNDLAQIIHPRPVRGGVPEFLESTSRQSTPSTPGAPIIAYNMAADVLQGSMPGIPEREPLTQIHNQPSTARPAAPPSTNRDQKQNILPNRSTIAGPSNSARRARVEEVDEDMPPTRNAYLSHAERLPRQRVRSQTPSGSRQPRITPRPSTPVPITRQLNEDIPPTRNANPSDTQRRSRQHAPQAPAAQLDMPPTRNGGPSDAHRLPQRRARPSHTPSGPRQPRIAPRPSTPVPISRQLPRTLRRAPSPNREDFRTPPAPGRTRRSSRKARSPPHVSNHTAAWHALELIETALNAIERFDSLHLAAGLCAVQSSLHRQRSIPHDQWVVHSFEWYGKFNERVRLIESLVGWVKQSIPQKETTTCLSSELAERHSSVGTLLFDVASKLHASFDRLERRYKHILQTKPHSPPHQVRAKKRAERLTAVSARAHDEFDELSVRISL